MGQGSAGQKVEGGVIVDLVVKRLIVFSEKYRVPEVKVNKNFGIFQSKEKKINMRVKKREETGL